MKLKEKITMLGIISLSQLVILGMSVSNNAEVVNKEVERVEQQIVKLDEVQSKVVEDIESIKDELSSNNERITSCENKISLHEETLKKVEQIEKELSELKKQPTNDKTNNDIEEIVELNPVAYKPVETTPQTIQEKEKPKENTSNVKEVSVRVSFYTSLASENGGYAGMNAVNGRLTLGSISAPKSVPFGSTISIPEMQKLLGITEFTVDDRGGAIFVREDGVYKLDVYVPQKQGESDNDYFKRVNNMGIVNTKAKIYFK